MFFMVNPFLFCSSKKSGTDVAIPNSSKLDFVVTKNFQEGEIMNENSNSRLHLRVLLLDESKNFGRMLRVFYHISVWN